VNNECTFVWLQCVMYAVILAATMRSIVKWNQDRRNIFIKRVSRTMAYILILAGLTSAFYIFGGNAIRQEFRQEVEAARRRMEEVMNW
jgi:predicted PurR-regulated permease PerM